jgi:hypothetical protein
VKIPVMRGLIERRVLVNYRIDPDVMASQLPPPFRPKLTRDGQALAGICLIRLSGIRPRLVPSPLGIRSENAAHRIAVEWDTRLGTQEGVFIPRRDSSSRLNAAVGGRLFPGVHHRAAFRVQEIDPHYRIELSSLDGYVRVLVEGQVAATLPESSTFQSVDEASRFFERGSLGYSSTPRTGYFDGLELRTFSWKVEPLRVTATISSFFEDEAMFPRGSVQFDCALLMRNVTHEWHAVDQLCGPSAA